jgi:hypothetical protein
MAKTEAYQTLTPGHGAALTARQGALRDHGRADPRDHVSERRSSCPGVGSDKAARLHQKLVFSR